MNKVSQKVLFLTTALLLIVAPLVAITLSWVEAEDSPAGVRVVLDSHLFATYTLESNLVYAGGFYLTSLLNITHGTFIEGNIYFVRINASTGEQSRIVLTDNLGIDHFILPVGDKIALAYSRFVSTAQRRDLNLTIIDPAGNEVLADIPIEATANYDEYPVLAYNPRTGTIAVAYFISS
ncbi:MAG: hypothetical protein QW196_01165, partial [Sulfolobales archaeon]